MRVALRARVSMRGKDQNPENQLLLLRHEAARAGDTTIQGYTDEEAGGKASRKQLKALMRDASKRQVDLVRVFAPDRLSRQGSEAVVEYTAALKQCGVSFWSYCEPMLNTTGPTAALYKAITAWAAGYRNERHSANVRLGQARKRAQVEAIGEQHQPGRRPPGPAVQLQQVASHDLSRRQIAASVDVSVGTVQNYLKAASAH